MTTSTRRRAIPASQLPVPGRAIDFDDKAGAILLGTPDHPYYAASSLDNYRQLYRTYRSDPMLQALHENFPMVATWDDHEYSNDCHGAVATYFDKRKDENDPVRRRRAEQAFFEFMPTAIGITAGQGVSLPTAAVSRSTTRSSIRMR